jgi:hypothetical protein
LRHYNGCSPDEWREVFRDIRTVEAHSWVAQSGEPRFLGARNELFWETLLADEWFSQAIHAWLTYHQGTAVTFNLVLDSGHTRYGIATGYDARVAKFSTGAKIIHHVNCDAFTRGLRRVNRGLGDPGYKTQLGARALSSLVDVVAFCPSWVGSVAYFAARTKLSLLRPPAASDPDSPASDSPGPDAPEAIEPAPAPSPTPPTETPDFAHAE